MQGVSEPPKHWHRELPSDFDVKTVLCTFIFCEIKRRRHAGSLDVGTRRAIKTMMREIVGVVQGEPVTRRRWFHDEYFDLFVWQNSASEIESFQLCYGIDSSERALEWRKNRGFFHDGAKVGTPVPGGILDGREAGAVDKTAQTISSRFDFAARALPDEVRTAVAARIREYAEKMPSVPMRRRQVRRAAWQKQGTETGGREPH